MKQNGWKKEYEELITTLRADKNNYAIQLAISLMKKSPGISYHSLMVEGLIGIGNLEYATKIAMSFTKYISDDQEAVDFANIAHANLLTASGKIMEAFEYYEAGLRPSDTIECPRINAYGTICRELALSRFGEGFSPDHLLNCLTSAKRNKDTFLIALSSAYILIAKTYLKQAFDFEFAQPLIDNIDQNSYTGLKALAYIATLLNGCYDDNYQVLIIDLIVKLVLRCEGVKAGFFLISEFFARHHNQIGDLTTGNDFIGWMNKYLKPIQEYQIQQDSLLFAKLPDEPYMNLMDCAHCDGRCCYDGVYITAAEEVQIKDIIIRYPEYFQQIPPNFTETGEWGFLFHGKRTIRVPHEYTANDFPSHFLHTKCIFAYTNGECSLQKVATDKGYHPWKFKPASCWQFPLIGLFNDNALEHPHYFGVKDPGFCDEKHPGYVSFMPCSKTVPTGKSWKNVFKNEIQFYMYKLEKKTNHKDDL